MLALRSLVFNLAFFLVTAILMIACLPTLFMGRHAVFWLARTWSTTILWLLRVICGMRVDFRGTERIPKGGLIIAPKHQSAWETFALLGHVSDFSYILKRELTWIPLFGWYLKAAEQIAIDRARGGAALAQATTRAREIVQGGRQVFIFPEGTRRPAGAPPKYKFGVAHIYAEAGVPCLPVALNSGLFWGRRTFIKRPGTVLVEFLEPIPPGLDKATFYQLLQNRR
jgi:1-acyl-sn-glycerol-3-phosphate acyltransferase